MLKTQWGYYNILVYVIISPCLTSPIGLVPVKSRLYGDAASLFEIREFKSNSGSDEIVLFIPMVDHL